MEIDLKQALRDSQIATRPYVLINPMMAKHLPATPNNALEYFALLGRKISPLCMGRRVLVIGFAETATAIGAAVSAVIENAVYVHTTREKMPPNEIVTEFMEEHSHAKNQALYLCEEFRNLTQYDVIVFVEDEITTGKTILNFLNNIKWTGEIIVSALVFNDFDANVFSEHNARFVCLQRTGAVNIIERVAQNKDAGADIKTFTQCGAQDKDRMCAAIEIKNFPNPRVGVKASIYQNQCHKLMSKIINYINSSDVTDKEILVIGTEEFMYPALYLGRELEKTAKSVKSHSTTRSPLLPQDHNNYPLKTRSDFASVYDNTRTTYLYNLAKYDTVVIVTDSVQSDLAELVNVIQRYGNQVIYVFKISPESATQAQNERSEPLVELQPKDAYNQAINKNRGTFLPDDVTILLKDITGELEPKPAQEREKLIQSGVHYSQMLPLEYKPSEVYLGEYYRALDCFAIETAEAVMTVSEKIYKEKGEKVVIVSLARAGTPMGVLIKRYLRYAYGINPPHYTISIVRGRGIDKNAMNIILSKHSASDIQFVDGWTGKGAILEELSEAVKGMMAEQDKRQLLAVIADPANITDMCGTHKDLPIASSFLNSTVCGLLSRTVIRPGIRDDELHGVAIYEELRCDDRTYEFIERIEKHFGMYETTGLDEVRTIAAKFQIEDINFIKPGIGEATRVLLRRVPEMILIAEDAQPQYVAHLIQLAKEKRVPVVRYPLHRYKACGVIKALTPDL